MHYYYYLHRKFSRVTQLNNNVFLTDAITPTTNFSFGNQNMTVIIIKERHKLK